MTCSSRLMPICCSAARTRTRLSRTLASGRPTSWKDAGPRPESTSTRIGWAVRPTKQKVSAVAITAGAHREERAGRKAVTFAGFRAVKRGAAGLGVAGATCSSGTTGLAWIVLPTLMARVPKYLSAKTTAVLPCLSRSTWGLLVER